MPTWEKYNFQYCPKLVIFNKNNEVLLCKRQGEEDFNWVFSFPGWKREKIDISIEIWIKREKSEEIWEKVRIKMYRLFNIEKEYVKKSWDTMILPHYVWFYEWWEIIINEEYSEYKWLWLDDINNINTIWTVIPIIKQFIIFKETDFFKESFKYNNFLI